MKPRQKAASKVDPLALIKSKLNQIDRKELIQNSVIVGILLVFIVFFFFPVLKRNRGAAADVFRLTNQLRTATNLIAKHPEMQKQKEVYGARIEKVRKGFFRNEELKQLIEIISTAASQNKVRITATQPTTKEMVLPNPFQQIYRIVGYEFMLEGAFHDLGQFINDLERHAKNFDVPELKMTRGEANSGSQKAVIIVNTYLERFQGG